MRTNVPVILALVLRTALLEGEDRCEKTIRDLTNFSLATSTTPDALLNELAPIERLSREHGDPNHCHAIVCLKIADIFGRFKPSVNSRHLEDRRRQLERDFTLIGLSDDDLPIEIEVDLLSHFRGDSSSRVATLSSRLQLATLWVHAWRRFEVDAVPNFNFDDWPFMNVPLPPGATGVAGMSPHSIRDPALRRLYEEKVSENREKAERYRTQLFLRRAKPGFLAQLERFFTRSFSASEISSVKQMIEVAPDKVEKGKILSLVHSRSP